MFLKGTHYFGDGSPINMWATIDKRKIQGDLENFASEGFNTIVLLIPWSGFQPDINSKELNSHYISILKKILTQANKVDIKIILRVGYLWDSTPTNMQTYERFSKLPISSSINESWLWFLRALKNEVKDFESYLSSFLSWEDFYWPIFRFYQDVKDEKVKYQFYQKTGFLNYINTIEASTPINKNENLKNLSINDTSPYFNFYLNYYDNFILKNILDLSSMVYDGIDYEYRVDLEWINSNKKNEFYNWNTNVHNSNLPIVYYHANIGVSHTRKMSQKQGIYHLKSLLERYSPMKRLGERLPFVDQLNFTDDTYENWAAIEITDHDEYAKDIYNTLKNHSSGYAIWGYKDWRKNILHNPFFYHKDTGWNSKNVEFEYGKAILNTDSSINQSIPHLALDEGERFLVIAGRTDEFTEFRCIINNQNEISVPVNGNFFEKIELPSIGKITHIQISNPSKNIVTLFEISILGRSFSQGFSNEIGEKTKIAKKIIELQLNE